MPISVPGNKVVTDLGHTTDHNLIRQALLDLDANSVKAERTPATGRWLLTSQDGGTLDVGDTGWRDISALRNTANWDGTVRIRRRGYTVTLTAEVTPTATPNAQIVPTIPAGFEPNAYSGTAANDAIVRRAGGVNIALQFNSISPLALYLAPLHGAANITLATTDNVYMSITWETEAAWPSSLPGTVLGQPRKEQNEGHEPLAVPAGMTVQETLAWVAEDTATRTPLAIQYELTQPKPRTTLISVLKGA